MGKKKAEKQVTLKIPEDLHTMLKVNAASAREGLTEYAVRVINEGLGRQAGK